MKGIFTYPNNASTHYIDPDYVGDANSGFERRIQELIDGEYSGWLGAAPADDVDAVMTGMGKYNKAFQETSGENTRFQFWVQPMVEFRMRAKAQHIKDISIDNHAFTDNGNDYNFLKLKVEFDDPHSFTDGQRLYIFTPTTPELGDVTNWYAEPIDSTHIYLRGEEVKDTNPPNHNQYLFPWLENGLYDNRHHGNNSSRAHRYQDGSVIRFDTAPPFYDNANIQLVSSFTEASDTGTLNQLSTPFYLQRRGGSSFTYEVFTDAAKTTRATLNEHYYDSVTKNYTTAGTVQLGNQTFSDWGITDASVYASNSNGWCRIIATVTSGTFTGNSSSNETIPTSISYADEFYWDHYTDGGVDKFAIYNKRSQEGTSIIQDFILADAGSGVDVDIEIKFINTARTPGGFGFYLLNNTYDEDASFSTEYAPRFEVNYATILLPGNQQFRYQDASNVTQNGAKYTEQWYAGMGSAFALDTDESLPADSTINLDSNGRLSGFTFPAGTSPDRGNFDIGTTRLMKFGNADSLYVAPTQTIAEQQDNWDTADYWLNNDYNADKEWPRTVRPASANWTIQQPSTQTVSQNGIKYVRKSGRVLYRFELEYPAMTYDQFKEYWSLVQAANGPATTFKFPLNYGSHRILFPANSNVPSIVRLLETTQAGGSLFTLEGYPTNQTDAIRNGELILLGGNSSINGGMISSITQQDANAYGEVKFRVGHPLNSVAYGTNLVYPNPDHIHVTLDVNDTVYTVDTAGFYYLTVAFMADYYK